MTPHHHLLHPVILLLLLSIAASCGSRSTIESQLDNIETVISDNPDSALTLLDAIPIDSLTPRPTRARQALLKSRALHKAFIDITSDSIINIALDYYTSASSPYALAEAHFYKGRIHMYQGRDRSAMTEYLNAENVLLNAPSDEHFLLGMIYQSISLLLTKSYLWVESLDYAGKSMRQFEQFRDSSYIADAKKFYSNILYLNDDYSSSIKNAKDVISYATTHKDSILLADAYILLSSNQIALGNYDSAY
ncbi:MAG: hypothetical protein K2I12_06430, partial [Duncaniella sp.]|nr:hypothetical protein [Duncaniella sp.]